MNAVRCGGAICLLIALVCGPVQAGVSAEVGARVLDGYIRPTTADLVGASRDLAAWLPSYCAAPETDGLRAAIEHQFTTLVKAWSRIEILRFGPLIENNRFERYFFFPDPRGVMLRQLQSLLAGADAARIDAAALRGDSVAVQGIPALEYALYGGNAIEQIAGNSSAGRYRCAYAQAISTNLATLAVELDDAWAGTAPIAAELAAPGPANRIYRSPQEVAAELLKAISTALQYGRNAKLMPALGDDASTARAPRAPLWRSGLTTAALATSLRGVLALYDASGLGAALPAEQNWIDDNIRAETSAAIAALDAVTVPFEQAVADDDARVRLVQATLVIRNLQSIVVEYLAPALGVNLGFNALDGD